MHVITLQNKEQLEYLIYIFHKYLETGVNPSELAISAQVWDRIKAVQTYEPPPLLDTETIRIPGSVSVVHEGDLYLPSGDSASAPD